MKDDSFRLWGEEAKSLAINAGLTDTMLPERNHSKGEKDP